MTTATAPRASYAFQVGMTVVLPNEKQGKLVKIMGQEGLVKFEKTSTKAALSTLTPLSVFQNNKPQAMEENQIATGEQQQPATETAATVEAPTKKGGFSASRSQKQTGSADKKAAPKKTAAKKTAKPTAKNSTPKKGIVKKASAKKAGTTERKVLDEKDIVKIAKDLAGGKLTYAQIKEKYGLNSMTPIAHIKKHKMALAK